MINLHEVTEQELASTTRSSKGNELTIAFKTFLASEQAKKLPKGRFFDLRVKDLLNVEKVHYYGLMEAVTETYSRGERKGQKRPEFDAELAKAVDIRFPTKYRDENAQVSVIRFCIK